MIFNKIFLIISVFVLTIAACEKETNTAMQRNKFFEVIDGDKSFASEMGSYESWFIRTDGFQELGFHKIGLYTSAKSAKMAGYTEGNLNSENRLDAFFINEYSVRSFLSLDNEKQSAIVEGNTGKEVTYKFIEQGKEIYSELLYLPEEITVNLELSNIDRFEGSGIGEYKIGMPLYINRDPQNSNGILVILSYLGRSVNTTFDDIQNSSASDNTEIIRYLYVPVDSGKIEFPGGFFGGIPDGGLFYLQINRANYKMFSIGEQTHKLSADMGYGIDLALAR